MTSYIWLFIYWNNLYNDFSVSKEKIDSSFIEIVLNL